MIITDIRNFCEQNFYSWLMNMPFFYCCFPRAMLQAP